MKSSKKLIAILLSAIMAFGMLTVVPFTAGAASQETPDGLQILSTNVDTPSDGCVFIGLEGSYVTQAQEALDLINSIRLEACKEGVENPDDGEPLTMDDYVPLKWSADLEYVARIRAAEASITRGHTRLNGGDIWGLKGPEGIFNTNEVLAWNYSETMTAGIEQWYAEKSDWIDGDRTTTSHYKAMIKPSNTCVGLASFCSSDTDINTTAGRFSSETGSVDETQGKAVNSCIQLIEVSTSQLGESGEISLVNIDNSKCACVLNTKINGITVRAMSDVQWSSGNADIPISSDGVLTANSYGIANVSASYLGSETTAAVYATELGFSLEEPGELSLGDVNGDKNIDITDVTAIQKFVAKIITFTDGQKAVANVNGDDDIDITDVTIVQKYVAKIITEFPAAAQG